MNSIRFCKKHGECEHVMDKTGRWRCKKCRSEAVQKRRDRLKLLAIEYKGGKCELCNYNKCIGALEFHHLNPSEKEFSIGSRGYTRSFEEIKKELDKCILVCANCHREIHFGNKIYSSPEPIVKEKTFEKSENKIKRQIPSKDDIIKALIEFKSFLQVGRYFGVSDNAVRKWCRKYDMPTHTKEIFMYINKMGE